MKNNLSYAHDKRISRIIWSIVYVTVFGLILFGLYQYASHISMRSLPVGSIQLSVPYSKYLVGEEITFTIKNSYNSPVYVLNNCPSEPLNVYRQDGTVWVRIHDAASITDCPLENRQIKIAPNSSIQGNFAAWHHLFEKPGKYRVVAYVEYYDALPYQDFEVIVAPQPPVIVPVVVAPVTPTVPAVPSQTVTPSQSTFNEQRSESLDD